jgi:hypothetical protein
MTTRQQGGGNAGSGIRRMTQDDITAFVTGLPGVVVVVASEANDAPEVAWDDSFFFYDPEGSTPANRRMPFATIVTKDYAGFDTTSDLNRPGVFRLNIGVGREVFEDLVGSPPGRVAGFDAAAIDTLIPHPVYAAQGWVAILNPGEQTAALARALLTDAHARAARRYRHRR